MKYLSIFDDVSSLKIGPPPFEGSLFTDPESDLSLMTEQKEKTLQ